MLSLLPFFPLVPPTYLYAQPIIQPPLVRPLPGALNNIPVFNSNSPELVLGEGILLSTFPGTNKVNPQAHLNLAFHGRFDLFAHHVAKPPSENDLRTLYLGIIVHNPTDKSVTLNLLQAASYLSQPDAPFVDLPPQLEGNKIYSGPGSRVMGEILQGQRQDIFPPQVTIPAGESRMLVNLPIPVQELTPRLNGRSTYMRLSSDGPVYLASLAMYAENPQTPPSLSEWEKLLVHGQLSTPRDLAPTPPDATGKIIYGRVAGVSQGNLWKTDLVDSDESKIFTIPDVGESFSYGLSTLVGGRLGTNQVQSAPLLVRYPDTAYLAHGNYGVQYSLTLPLYNPHQETRTVSLAIATPIKQDTPALRFLDDPGGKVFFRGMIQLKYNDHRGIPRLKYVHLVQKQGERGEDLLTLTMPPQSRNLVSIDFLYPPDATPPQILMIRTD
jgi:hypothetical protein